MLSACGGNASIDVGEKPISIAVSPDGQTLYVAHYTLPGKLSVVDVASKSIRKEIPLENLPKPMLLLKDGQELWVINTGSNNVAVIDTQSLQVTQNISVGLGPTYMTYHPLRHEVYVVNAQSHDVSVIDPETYALKTQIKVGASPAALIFHPEVAEGYITHWGSGTIGILNLEQQSMSQLIEVGEDPRQLILSPDGKTLFIGNVGDQTISWLDIATKAVYETLTLTGSPADLIFANDKLLALTVNEDALHVIDLGEQRVIRTLVSGDFPREIRRSMDESNGFVVARQSAELLQYDLKNFQLKKTFKAGTGPLTFTVVDHETVVTVDFESGKLHFHQFIQ